MRSHARPATQPISEAEAEQQLAQQAFRQVQFGAEGGAAAWDRSAQDFLRRAGTQSLPDGGYMFFALPDQRANATMYLDSAIRSTQFYAANSLKQPTVAELQAAATRDTQLRSALDTATKSAFVASAAISVAGLPPTLLSWALTNPLEATTAGVISAETAAAITSGAVTPSSLAPLLTAGGIRTVSKLEDALSATAAEATAGGLVNASKVCGSACAITSLDANEQALVNLIQNGADKSGALTEQLLAAVAQRTGMTVVAGGKYGANNGFDLVLQGQNGAITVILDAKQLTASGAVKLSTEGAGGANQLSPAWVEQVMENIRRTNPNSPAIAAIAAAQRNDSLSIAVGGVNRTTGQLLVVPVVVPNKSAIK